MFALTNLSEFRDLIKGDKVRDMRMSGLWCVGMSIAVRSLSSAMAGQMGTLRPIISNSLPMTSDQNF